ncbi:MAG: polyhydroxybutyrate depolymerase [Solirubrobacteraceae bacterium]|nr:polyhydroxybutyrate depolymerase [Solirubrobacteraceae bacterium]
MITAARTAAARALVACICATALGACGSSHPASGTAKSSIGAHTAPKNEAQINPLTCTAAQLAQRQPPIVYRPRALGARKAPLVIALHGAFGNGRAMAELTGFQNVASRRGFVAVFPSACDLRRPWGSGQDLYYLDSLIRGQIASDNVDPRRVYIAGFSAGGVDAWRMACMFSDDVAAIAVVSESMSLRVSRACVLSKPVSQLLMVGTADGNRWTGAPGHAMSAVQATVWWRTADKCTSASTLLRPIPRVLETTWAACAGGSHVALVEVLGAAHVWPPAGVGAPPGYNASEAVWSFLSKIRAPA